MVSDWLNTLPSKIQSIDDFDLDGCLLYGLMDFEDEKLEEDGKAETDFLRLEFSACLGSEIPVNPFEIWLGKPLEDGSKDSKMRTRPNYDLYNRTSIAVSLTTGTNCTSDETCFRRIRKWIDTCERDHDLCNLSRARSVPRRLPTRLLKVDKASPHPRLIATSDHALKPETTRYMTLSHRWSSQAMPRLLHANYQDFKASVSTKGFPRSFRDALHVALRLDIQYVWIDALCIIQDDSNDWRNEAALMGDVYKNATYNIGALGVLGHAGLYTARDPRRASVVTLQIVRSDFNQRCVPFPWSA
jgi:hypothetical protein